MSLIMQQSAQTPPQSPTARTIKQPNVEDVRAFFDKFKTIFSSPDSNAAFTVFEEISELKRRLQLKDDKITKLEEDLKRLKITINELTRIKYEEKAEQVRLLNNEQSRVKNLQDTVADKEKSMAELRQTVTELKKEVENLGRARDDNDVLKKSVKEKETLIEKMKLAGSELKKQLVSSRENNEVLQKEKQKSEDSAQAARAQLSKFQNFAASQQDVDFRQIADNFDGLWSYATNEIYSKLSWDFSDKLLQALKSDEYLPHSIPLPRSDSEAARQMWLVIILAKLVKEIDRHIFQPAYILQEDSGIRELLARLAEADGEKEAHCRSVLLSINAHGQDEVLQSKLKTVVGNTTSRFHDAIPEQRFNEFKMCIENIVQKAAEIWQPIQHAKQKYETDFAAENLGQFTEDFVTAFYFPKIDSQSERSQSERSQPERSQLGGKILLTVFPGIYVVEDCQRCLIVPVTLVLSLQPECIAAEKEEMSLSSRSYRETLYKTLRRQSASVSKDKSHPNGDVSGRK